MAELPGTRKPAIFLKYKATVAEVLATAAVYEHLRKTDKQVTLLTDNTNPSLALIKKILSDVNFKSELPTKKFLLSLPKGSADVNGVQWQQEGDKINIYITMDKGNLSAANLKFDVLGADYDLAILPGITNLNQLGNLIDLNQDFFKETKLFTIGSDLNLGDNYSYSSSNRPTLTTLAEQVFALIEAQQPHTIVCQHLLAAIMIETDNLNKDLKSGETFTIMRKLVDKGAKLSSNKTIIAKLNEEAQSEKGIVDTTRNDADKNQLSTHSLNPLQSSNKLEANSNLPRQ